MEQEIEVFIDQNVNSVRELTESNLMNEIWKDVPNFNGNYSVSNMGRVRSNDRIEEAYKGSTYYTRNRKGRILKQRLSEEGYCRISLLLYSKYYMFNVHRLVMFAFEGESELQVDHINGIKDDNRLENLRYCTQRENIHYYNDTQENMSKYHGVVWSDKMLKWTCSITINKKRYHLGVFTCEIEASNAYIKALRDWEELQKLPERVKPKTSKHIGISYCADRDNWRAIYKRKWIGHYKTEGEAYKALCEHKESLGIS